MCDGCCPDQAPAYLDGSYPGFDRLVATVFLIFQGSQDRAWTFLHRLSCLGCSAYLLPARMHASVGRQRVCGVCWCMVECLSGLSCLGCSANLWPARMHALVGRQCVCVVGGGGGGGRGGVSVGWNVYQACPVWAAPPTSGPPACTPR